MYLLRDRHVGVPKESSGLIQTLSFCLVINMLIDHVSKIVIVRCNCLAEKKNICFILDASIKANGYRSKNTSDYHCAGGSSGGLIRVKAYKVKQYSRTGAKKRWTKTQSQFLDDARGHAQFHFESLHCN